MVVSAGATKFDLGAVLLGCVFQAIFYGNALSLAWRYFTVGRGADSRWFSLFVGIGWLLCTFSLVISADGLWYYVIEKLFQRSKAPTWSVDFFLLVNAIETSLVRLIYVYRLGKLCPSIGNLPHRVLYIVMLTLTVLLTIASLACYVVTCIQVYVANGAYRTFVPVTRIAFATGVAANAVLAIILCVRVRSARALSKIPYSTSNTLIAYTVQTGLIPGLVDMAGMVSYLAKGRSRLSMAFYIQVGILYLTSLLTCLNARPHAQHRTHQPLSFDFNVSAYETSAPGATANLTASSTAPPLSPRTLGTAHSLDVSEFYADEAGEVTPDIERPAEYYSEKMVTPDIERPREELEREQLARARTSATASVPRPRAFTLPDYQHAHRRFCT